MNRFLKHPWLTLEFILLCLVIPGILIGFTLAHYMFAFLWAAALYAIVILYIQYKDVYKNLWRPDAVTWSAMKPILIRWIIGSVLIYLFTLWYDPDRLFYVLEHRPQIIPMLMFGYPVLSALPQELIFCSFFFARYAPFFGTGRAMVIASAVVFAYAHVLYINPVAPTLGFIAGLIFAYTYLKSKSLLLVTIEHGLYGNSLFLIGLGWYFYRGSVGA